MQEKPAFVSPVAATLRLKNIIVEADERALKNLAVKTPSLFIVNQALADLDELVMIHLLSGLKIPFRIMVRKDHASTELSEHFLFLDYNLLEWEDYIKAIFKNLVLAKEYGYSICLILHFTDNSL
jgi:hypothetical protein